MRYKILLIAVIAWALIAGERDRRMTIIEGQEDDRGLISVIATDGRDTFAFDFLNEREMDSIFGITDLPHECRWTECPYKGVTCAPGEWNEAVYDYTECERGTDCYYIDILHLRYPAEEYDQLEDRLFKLHSECDNDASILYDNLTN